ncbi:type IV pilin protein [Variovorax fucosicus]|uniref:type IV pilin protein n=1 Tax=Variovorax fucosicus TaxID=3053517 RepID=UPI0025770A67|nr:type IV pilin protein [Variovorax sp. J22G47]MDM0054910.1 type IV pilin protein [Variovorax sp. J22G47]
MTRNQFRQQAGFSLIELMITVAIVAILAAIAYPSYQESIAKGKRAQAKTVLSQAQQWLERNYSENYRYDQTAAAVAINNTAGGLFASQFGVAPVPSEGAAAYTITIDTSASSAGNKYTLTATRTGAMTNDRCGDFTVTNTGRKAVVNHSGFGTGGVADLEASRKCWG